MTTTASQRERPESRPGVAGSFRGFVLDVDGTLIHGPAAVDGAAAAVGYLRANGRHLVVATNNSQMNAAQVAAHLTGLGIAVAPAEVVSVVDATARWLACSGPGATALVLGSPALKDALRAAGIDVREAGVAVDYVVTGGDRTFDYAKLTDAVRAVLNGAQFVATNQDGLVIEPAGVFPGGGAIAGAIAGAIGRAPDVVVGKPSAGLFEEALRRLALPAAQCAVVGDSLVSDVAAAHRLGMGAILVLSGVTRREAIAAAPDQPDLVIESIADLPGAERRGRP